MYPSTYKAEFRSARIGRRQEKFLKYFLIAGTSYLAALTTFAWFATTIH